MKKKTLPNFLFSFKSFQRLVFLFVLSGCMPADNNSTTFASSDIDAGRKFVRAALDGKFDQAQGYLLSDSLNLNYLEVAARSYEKLSNADKASYKGASIVVHENRSINDSTTLLIFSNSFKNDKDTLRVVRKDNKWVVDLAYLFLNQHDNSASPSSPKLDSLR